MTRYLSPLRYPGGKTHMAPYLAEIFHAMPSIMDIELWVEPFGGGAGAALKALRDHNVPEAWIVEHNPALAAFWTYTVSHPEDMARWVETYTPTLHDYYRCQHLVAAALDGNQRPTDELARAAFIVNRCSRSGMIMPGVGPMGGKHQNGTTRLTDRWNPHGLAQRFRALIPLASSITVYHCDGISLVEELPESGIVDEVFIFADPPYIGVGNDLYARGMDTNLHQRLAAALRRLNNWVLTYDAHPDVLAYYAGESIYEFDIPHTAGSSRIGKEYLVTPWENIAPERNPLGKGTIRRISP